MSFSLYQWYTISYPFIKLLIAGQGTHWLGFDSNHHLCLSFPARHLFQRAVVRFKLISFVWCRITVLSWSRWNKCTSSKYYEYSWLWRNSIISSVRKCCVPSFVVFGVWSFQEQKSGLKELTGNSDWNTQQEKRKRCKRPTYFVPFCNYSLLSTKVWNDSINFRSNNGRMRLLSNQFQNHCVHLVLFPEKWFERLNPKWSEADGSDHQIDRCLSESNLSLLIVSLHLWHISC